MLRTAVIASLGLRRLVASSATAAAPGSQSSLLLRSISAPIASSRPAIQRFLPTLDLRRDYARGRQGSYDDDDGGYDYEPDYSDDDGKDMNDMYEISDMDELSQNFGDVMDDFDGEDSD